MTLCLDQHQTNRIASSKGFTLVEMVLVIVITGILTAIGALIVTRGLASYFTERDITAADWQGRIALERMTRELRLVRARTDLPAGVLPAADITFTDIDGNVIRYCLGNVGCTGTTATSLTRSSQGSSQVLADNVTALGFSYLTSSNVITTDRLQVNSISVAISVNQNSITTGFRGTVNPRNF